MINKSFRNSIVLSIILTILLISATSQSHAGAFRGETGAEIVCIQVKCVPLGGTLNAFCNLNYGACRASAAAVLASAFVFCKGSPAVRSLCERAAEEASMLRLDQCSRNLKSCRNSVRADTRECEFNCRFPRR